MRNVISVSTSCSRGCRIATELRLGKAVLARASRRLARAGNATVRLRLSAKVKRRLRAARRTKAVLRITIVDGAGHRRIVSQRVTFG